MILRNVKSQCLYKFNVMLQVLSRVETVIPNLRMHIQVFYCSRKLNTSSWIFRDLVWFGLGFEVFLVGWCFVLLFCFCFVLNCSKLLLPFFSQMLLIHFQETCQNLKSRNISWKAWELWQNDRGSVMDVQSMIR